MAREGLWGFLFVRNRGAKKPGRVEALPLFTSVFTIELVRVPAEGME